VFESIELRQRFWVEEGK